MKKIIAMAVVCACLKINAQESPTSRADAHAPIGVMGDHIHKKGEFMVSYRFMSMKMDGNFVGNDEISADEIVATIENRFNMPPTLRVVPENMTMMMHMVGFMYAPSDKLTLMGMTMILSNEMDHITYQGMMGTNVAGKFTTESKGLGDTKLTAMIKLTDKSHFNLGVNIPTGSIKEVGQVLAPTGMEPILRLPYPMQLGSGTWDLLPAFTYSSRSDKLGWGGKVSGVIRLGETDFDYTLGNQLGVTAWGSYLPSNWISTSLRINYSSISKIDGIDPNIAAPVQTANPDFQGGSRLDALLGINLIGQSGFIKNQRLAIEVGMPLLQDLNGPQLKTTNSLTLGYQYAF